MVRCHRIGQTRPVVVYRLCTKGSVDEHIIGRANAKRFLEKAVISKEGNLVNSKEGLMALQKFLDENAFTIVDSKKQGVLLNLLNFLRPLKISKFLFIYFFNIAVYTDAELDDLLDRSDMINMKRSITPLSETKESAEV